MSSLYSNSLSYLSFGGLQNIMLEDNITTLQASELSWFSSVFLAICLEIFVCYFGMQMADRYKLCVIGSMNSFARHCFMYGSKCTLRSFLFCMGSIKTEDKEAAIGILG